MQDVAASQDRQPPEGIAPTDAAAQPSLSASIALAPPFAQEKDALAHLNSVVAAFAGHVVVGALFIWISAPALIGGGGTDVEAIGVELIPAAALDSLAAEAGGAGASRAAVDTAEGADRTSAASAATDDRREEAAKPKPEAAAERPDLVIPEWQKRLEPPDPEAIQLAIARAQAERAAEADAEPAATALPMVMTPSAAAALADDAATGGAAAQANAAADDVKSARATAAVGDQMAGYNRALVGALGLLRRHLETASRRLEGGTRGKLVLQLTVGADGAASQITVTTSSGNRQLDDRAVAAVQSFRFPLPPSLASAADRTYKLPIEYR